MARWLLSSVSKFGARLVIMTPPLSDCIPKEITQHTVHYLCRILPKLLTDLQPLGVGTMRWHKWTFPKCVGTMRWHKWTHVRGCRRGEGPRVWHRRGPAHAYSCASAPSGEAAAAKDTGVMLGEIGSWLATPSTARSGPKSLGADQWVWRWCRIGIW